MSYSETPSYKDDVDEYEDQEPITASAFANNSHSMLKRGSKRIWYIGGCGVVLVLFAIILAVSLGGGSGGGAGSLQEISAAEIESILREVSETGGVELDDTSTFQYKAFRWIVDHPWRVTNFVMSARHRLLQRYALACVYYATYQQSNEWLELKWEEPSRRLFPWKDSKGWLIYNNECDWSGVDCNRQGYVTDVDLGTNDLSGFFPSEFAYLAPSLQSLNIQENYCYNRGDKGNAFFGKLVNLEFLYMRDGLFQNEGIPTHFGLLTNLQEIDCSYGLYHGPLSPEIFENFQSLRYLEISGNFINGTIPASLATLPKLKYFYAANCGLEDTLDFVLQMPVVVEAWLDRNPLLAGKIPEELGPQMTTLESFSVTRSGLTGTLPSSLGEFERMQQMWFYINQLTGTIPTELGELKKLRTFKVEGNNIVGDVPMEVCERKAPIGYLSKMHADCGADGGDKVRCNCCDCCGPICVVDDEPVRRS
jgi:hypothetical protein